MVGKRRSANTSGVSANSSTASFRVNYEQLTKEQLKTELKKHGLKCSGNKRELLHRVRESITMPSWVSEDDGPAQNIAQAQSKINHRMSSLPDDLESAGVSKRHHLAETNGGPSPASNGKGSSTHPVPQSLREEWKRERESLVLWKHPVLVLHYFLRETLCLASLVIQRMNTYRISVGLSLMFLLSVYISTYVRGPHQALVLWLEKRALWCLYWTGLGVLSSVGLGTGFHTFLLYLGPHIAKVSLAAYECGSLQFPEPPYPDEILCPQNRESDWVPSLWSILNKVKLEAMMWGAGTALGELPPYFLSRAARLSLLDPEEVEEVAELEELHRKKSRPETMTLVDKLKLKIETLVNKVGFFGILACASIPNPLFDLAGITCGHFLIPFWTFFGATLIGKAVIKMSMQVVFVIALFNESLINRVLAALQRLPLGSLLVEPVTDLWRREKGKLRHTGAPGVEAQGGNILASLIEYVVMLVVLFFVISIVNAMAQAYHKRLHSAAKTKK